MYVYVNVPLKQKKLFFFFWFCFSKINCLKYQKAIALDWLRSRSSKFTLPVASFFFLFVFFF